jgi:hypothetical protein
MASRYFLSPIGDFSDYPWINKPDTKFNADGLYHTGLDVPLEEALPTMEKIEAAAKASLAKQTDEMTPGQAKKWSLQLPFEELEDEEGEKTGIVRFTFKQNAKIKTKDKGVKHIKIEVRDAADKIIDASIWGGDKGRIMFTMRDIVITSAQRAGVRLDFAKVQLVEKGNGTSQGFGAVDGGYVANEGSSEDDYDPDNAGEGEVEKGDY